MSKKKVRKIPAEIVAPPQPTEKQFTAQVQTQQLVIKDPNEAETFRKFLEPYENDAVIRQNNQWVYVRTRAFVQEVASDGATNQNPPSAGSEAGSGEAAVRPDSSGPAA